MHLDRRSFLGSTIGFFLVGPGPFVARAPGRPMPALEDPDGLIRLFDMPFEQIRQLLVVLELEIGGDRQWIIGRMGYYQRDSCSVAIHHADFEPMERTIAHGIALKTRNDTLIARKAFNFGARWVNPGDTLKASFIVTRPMVYIDGRHVPGRPPGGA